MKPLISVIIPTYQRCSRLKIAIDSVLSQTFKNFELLVIDDGSTDGTKEMVKAINDPRIIYKWSKNSGGPAKPRNYGIKISSGKWIAFLDSDDSWKKNKLNEVVKYFNSGYGFIYHDFSMIYSNKNINNKIFTSKKLKSPITLNLLVNGNIIGLSTVVILKKLLIKIKGFNENVKMGPCADYNAWLKTSMICKNFFYLSKNLGNYYIDGNNMSNQDMTISRSLAVREFLHLLTQNQRKKLLSKYKYESGCFNYNRKNYNKSIQLFKFSLKSGGINLQFKSTLRLICVFVVNFFK